MSYTVIEPMDVANKIPLPPVPMVPIDSQYEIRSNKPRWMPFLVFAAAALAIIAVAVTVGIVVGYTYCYIEHRSKLRANLANISEDTVHIYVPSLQSTKPAANKTINNALMSNIFVSRILSLGESFMTLDDLSTWISSEN